MTLCNNFLLKWVGELIFEDGLIFRTYYFKFKHCQMAKVPVGAIGLQLS